MRAILAEEATVPKSIAVEAESPDDSATMFSLRIDDLIVGRGLTAAQAHLLVGEILERVVLPRRMAQKQLVSQLEASRATSERSGNP
jgi:hypothetical protein